MSRAHELAQKVRQRRIWVGAAIAAAALATAVTVAAIESTDGGAPPQHAAGQPSGSPWPKSPRREPAKSHSPATWEDTKLKPRIDSHG